MRPTDLQFRSPKEQTAEHLYPTISKNGKLLAFSNVNEDPYKHEFFRQGRNLYPMKDELNKLRQNTRDGGRRVDSKYTTFSSSPRFKTSEVSSISNTLVCS